MIIRLPSSWPARLRRPQSLIFLTMAVVLGWIAWQTWQLIPNRPLSAAEVSAAQVTIHRRQLTQLETRLPAYHEPAAPEIVAGQLFLPVETPAADR
ncbi:MAG: hypothetical protein HYY50_02475 [Candidatus Kerfeldbacteria bacterium]|nr:hypothetical protein [Candidatus Kerfeldbacteria bacterium]